jgi:hypothetical protein
MGHDIDTCADEVLFTICSDHAGIFLDFDKLLSMSRGLTEKNFSALRRDFPDHVDNFLEPVQEYVYRFVPIGNSTAGSGLARGVEAVINNVVVPELTKTGDLEPISFYKELSANAMDNRCGIRRGYHIDAVIPKKEYIEQDQAYYNLFYTLQLHCPGVSYSKGYVQSRCCVHSLGHDSVPPAEEQKRDGQGKPKKKASMYVVRDSDAKTYGKTSVLRPNFIPLHYGKSIPGSVLTQAKPILTGISTVKLRLGKLAHSLTSYLTAKAVLIAPSYTTLSAAVQAMLLAKFTDVSKIPGSLIQSLTGIAPDEAAEKIFTSKVPAVVNSKAKRPQSDGKPKPKPVNKDDGGKGGSLFDSLTKKQKHKVETAFGGGFSAFRKIKTEFRITGKVDILKLSNHFEAGKPKAGDKFDPKKISSACSLN